MAGGAALIWLGDDDALDRLSARLHEASKPAGPAGELLFKAARVAADVKVIESSLLTLGIARTVLPVLPGVAKLGAVGAAAMASVALVAATIDIVVQLGELKIAMGLLSGAPASDIREVTDRLEKLTDPIGAILDKVIEYLSRAGFSDADKAGLLKEFKAFKDATSAAEKAVNPLDKLKHGLASIEAARKFFDKLGPTAKDKVKDEVQRIEREHRERVLREQKPDYDGVDYPNQPGDPGPGLTPGPGGGGGSAVA